MSKAQKRLENISQAVLILKEQFYLNEWTIVLTEDEIESDALSEVTLTIDIRHAKIIFNPDVVKASKKGHYDKWLKTVIHEMLHIRMALVTEGIVQRQMDDHKDPGMFWSTFVSEIEPTVEILAHIIYEQWRGWPKDG